MLEILSFEFMQNALMAALLASVACGVIGTLVVVNRLVFMAGGIAHTAYGGVGLALFFGLPVMPCSIAFTLGAAWLMAAMTYRHEERLDSVVGLLWAGGMALGIILMDLTPGYHVDLMSYLFGSILSVPRFNVWLMLLLVLLILGIIGLGYKKIWVMSFDLEFAKARGINVKGLYFLLLSLVAVTVVLIIQVVGLILVIALLTIPPFLAETQTVSLHRMMGLAVLWSAFFCLGGLLVSYAADISSGASIIAVGVIVALIVFSAGKLFGLTRNAR
jgi:zinc transport system permease protein